MKIFLVKSFSVDSFGNAEAVHGFRPYKQVEGKFRTAPETRLRTVSQSSSLWRSGGIASTDIAALVGMGYGTDDCPLVCWSRKVAMRERQAMKKIPELDQGTSAWFDFREKGIGGSEIASLVPYTEFGKNPYSTPSKLWEKKTGLDRSELAENENLLRGKRLEPIARQRYEDLFGWKVTPVCVVHSEFDWCRASLDGLRTDDRLVCEIKAPREQGHKKVLAGQITPYYYPQVMWQMLICDAPLAHFVSYNESFPPHQQLKVIEVQPDSEYQKMLLARAKEFWEEFVVKRVPPPAYW